MFGMMNSNTLEIEHTMKNETRVLHTIEQKWSQIR